MMFSSNASRFFLVLAAAFSAVTSAEGVRGRRSLESTVALGGAGNYAILAKTGISTVPSSAITGNIAVSPIASTAMTGFSLTADSGGTFSTSTQVTGQAFSATHADPTPNTLTTAVSDMEAAYGDAKSRFTTDDNKLDLGAGTLGAGGDYGGANAPLTPGVYTFGSRVKIADDIEFAGTGVFIIQVAGDLIQATDVQVILSNGALAQNIFWQVEGFVEVNAGAHLEGILLVKTKADFKTGSSLNGRILSQTACTLDQATITQA
jgi:hypothetical protein